VEFYSNFWALPFFSSNFYARFSVYIYKAVLLNSVSCFQAQPNINQRSKKMFNRNKRMVLITAMLICGFFGGLIVASHTEMAPASFAQDKTKASSTNLNAAQGRLILQQFSAAFEEAAAKVNAAVVPIFSEQAIEGRSAMRIPNDQFRDFFGDEFFRRFFNNPDGDNGRQRVRGLGSGVIVSRDGYILTNNHVIREADKVTVMLGENKKYTAKVIGTDPSTDLAVIKIDATNLPAAALGNSDDVRIGQWVIAVGNPFELLHTVTAGIVSAKGRSTAGLNLAYQDFIQTDASINPGNSGGALADLDGNVVGINTAISTPSGGSVGIGFAIPINMAKQVMDELVSQGKVTRGYLALVPQDIDESMAKAWKLKSTEGALVGDVTPNGPADKAGIQRGDIITNFNGKKILNSTQLRQTVAQADPGTKAKISLLRDGREMPIAVVLGERPTDPDGRGNQDESAPEVTSGEKLGLSIQTLTPEMAQQLGYRNDDGVIINSVIAGSPAEEAGLRRGDLIKEINRTEVRTAQEFKRLAARLQSGDSAVLLINRRGQNTFYAAIQVP
jgi:serine protease Do